MANGKLTDEEICKLILDAFQKKFNLGPGNNYSTTILEEKIRRLCENVNISYSGEQSSLVKDFTTKYLKLFKERFSGTASKENQEKKTDKVVPLAQTTQTQTGVNA